MFWGRVNTLPLTGLYRLARRQSQYRLSFPLPVKKKKYILFYFTSFYFFILFYFTLLYFINRLTPNDTYMGHTAPLTSKCYILYIYSTNIGTEYFKHALYSPFFFSSKCSLFHNANLFGSYITDILYTGCAKIKKKIIPAPKC